jgi:class 3 adenylate cyclase
MFSDLVGSTELSARMDPEDLREVIAAYQKCVAETVQRIAGFVAKYMGDGVLVYFGYPPSARGRRRAGSPTIGCRAGAARLFTPPGAYQLRTRREARIERDRTLRTFVVDRFAKGWTPEQLQAGSRAETNLPCGRRDFD